jgi:signal transduction histidine kinase
LLEKQQQYSNAVVSIARAFVSLDSCSGIIDKALERLGSVSRADRAYLFRIDREKGIMDNTNEWCSPGTLPEMDNLHGLSLSLYPWWMELLSEGEIIDVEDVSAMGVEARAEQALLESQDIKSVLVLPVFIDKELAGFVGMDNVHSASGWDKERKRYLKVAADMLGMTIRKYSDEQKILEQKRELEHAYENLKQTQVQLLWQEKLASIGQLTAGVAHEINNPVSFVKGNSEALQNYVESLKSLVLLYESGASKENIADEKKRLNIDYVLKDIQNLVTSNINGMQRITDILMSLKNFSRVNSTGKVGEVDVEEGIQDTLAIARYEIREDIRVVTRFGGGGMIRGISGELNQVFLNILLNAVHSIRGSRRKREGRINISTYGGEDSVSILFEDNGHGIADRDMGRIFESFFTTRKEGEGTGLGLNISYDIIVNRHGGTITAENLEEGGARFTIRLPR